MLDKFWESLATSLANKWITVSTPAMVFWLGGVLAWTSRHGFGGVERTLTRFANRPASMQVIVLMILLLGIASSAVVVEQLAIRALPLLEGYWPPWTNPLRYWLVRRKAHRLAGLRSEWSSVADAVHKNTASAEQRRSYLELDRQLRIWPADARLVMPTRLGNILRAAEGQPWHRYRLESTVTWPRLWLVLPVTVRVEVGGARSALTHGVAAFIWAIAFCSFGVLNIAAVAVGLILAATIYFLILPARAITFGSLFEAAYDLHRTELFKTLRWPLPSAPEHDRQLGEALTNYLLRGVTSLDRFVIPPQGDS